MTKNVLLLPWVLLAAAVVVSVAIVRDPSEKADSESEVSSATPPPPSSSPGGDAHLTDKELRDVQVHIPHEDCDDATKRIADIEGNPGKDTSRFRITALCLRRGNLAWYKCIVGAKTKDDVAMCGRRLLNSTVAP